MLILARAPDCNHIEHTDQGQDPPELPQKGTCPSPEQDKDEITSQLQQLKASYRRLRQHAIAGALTADKLMRRYPYSTAGFAFAFGLLAGRCMQRKR